MMNTDSSPLNTVLSIDRQGIITNVRPLTGLDGVYQFAVIAADSDQFNTSVSVFMKILATSRCQPTIVVDQSTTNVFMITEGSSIGHMITVFNATTTGDDCIISYVIWNSDTHKYTNATREFSINSQTGELKSLVIFDHEVSDRYEVRLLFELTGVPRK
jgi:hypothetical protein